MRKDALVLLAVMAVGSMGAELYVSAKMEHIRAEIIGRMPVADRPLELQPAPEQARSKASLPVRLTFHWPHY